MSTAVGEAPGKILLIGEHSVVYSHPAIAIPLRSVNARVESEFTRDGQITLGSDDLGEVARPGQPVPDRLAPLVRLSQRVLELFGEGKEGVRVRIRSTIPVGRGMGSGAAVAVALIRSLCKLLNRALDAEQVMELALEAEKEFHGDPSGVDCAVVALNEPVYFTRGKPPQPIIAGRSAFRFVVADTGVVSPTRRVVEFVRQARDRDRARYDSFFWELGSMASVAREVLRTGCAEEMALCMNRAHEILREMGVSSAELDQLVSAALENGALGAKLSGAGQGGVMIALLAEDGDEDKIIRGLQLAGARQIFATALTGE